MDQLYGNQKEESGFSPVELWRMFWRRKWLFFVPFIICLGMGYLAIKTMPPVYRTSGQLRVILEQTSAQSIPEANRRYRRSRDADKETMVIIRTIVTSPKFLERTVRDLNLHRSSLLNSKNSSQAESLSENSAVASLVSKLEKWILVKNDDTNLFSIGIKHQNPDLVYLLTSEIINRFLEEERANRLEPSTSTMTFLEKQRSIMAGNLGNAQTVLTNYKVQSGQSVLSSNPVREGNLSQANSLLSDIESQFISGKVTFSKMKELSVTAVAETDKIVSFIERDATILAKLEDLKAVEYNSIISRLSRESNYGVTAGSIRVNIDIQIEQILRNNYPEVEMESRVLLQRYINELFYRTTKLDVINKLKTHIRLCMDFMAKQPEQSAKLSQLNQNVLSAQEMLKSVEEDISRENLRLAASLSEIGYKIVVRKDPGYPEFPFEPDKKRLAMMAVAIALAIGAGLVLLAEMLDKSLKTVEQIEKKLDVTVVGTMPIIKNGPFGKHRRIRVLIWMLIIVIILALSALGLFYLYPQLR
jgi:polysaccharide biosynthesis transport protein